MSLNGLDDAAVKEAHNVAVSEPGGWFLLKYASRDEIDLLGQGSGGIVEIRNAITQYEDASPLYGFLRYRRRNVIIKYLPENCSRLVQARVTVHFNAVCERFAPYNTTFSITEAKELKDTKLSAACSLHTASSSTSSSTSSLRRRRLMEIAEEEEEEHRATKRQSTVKEEDRLVVQGQSILTTSPPVTLNAQLAESPNESQFASTAEPPSFTGGEGPSSPSKSPDPRRLSSQLTRPEMYSYATYTYGKPKVKLAPRPSFDVSGRPRTSGGTGTYRPVSAIPAGFKLFSHGSRRGRGDGKHGDHAQQIDEEKPGVTALSAAEIAAIPVPADPPQKLDAKRPHTSGGRPTSSSGISIKSAATTAMATTAKQNTMTPEKARLMKAMKLREKKMNSTIQPPLPIPTVDVIKAPPELESTDAVAPEESFDATSVASASFTSSFDDRPGSSGEATLSNFTSNAGSGDSAIDVGLATIDQASIDTHTTDSHPASPLATSSEIGKSTKASSLSESTDETVQALQDLKSEVNVNNHEDEVVESDNVSDHGKEAVESDNDLASLAAKNALQSSAVGISETAREEEALPSKDHSNPGTEDCKDKKTANPENSSQTPKESSSIALSEEQPILETTEVFGTESESANSTRPNTSTTSELSSGLEHETPTASIVVPAIVANDLRDSQSTIGLETSDSASHDNKRARRRALVDPIRTDLHDKSFDANLSDDEDLMEELQSATVQEAKPITVSKSPMHPVFPGSSPSKSPHAVSGSDIERNASRTVSNPIRGSLLVPGDVTTSSARSVSSGAAFLHKIAQQSSANLAHKKSNIGSSISQRIKALEKLSGSTPGPVVESPTRVERPTSTFFSVRKPAGRDSSKSPSVAERASSLHRDKTPSPPTSRESTPEMPRISSRDRSGSMANRLSMFEGGRLPRGRPESVQVRARIIRDPAQPFPKLPDQHYDPSETNQLDFKQSPLVVNHQKASPLPVSIFSASGSFQAAKEISTEPIQKRESIQERRMSRENRRSQSYDRSTVVDEFEGTRPRRRSSLSIVKDFIKERRGSVLGTRSPSTDNLQLNNLSSPASLATSAKSPSRPPSVHNTHGLARRLSISSRRSTSKDRDMSTPPLNTPLSPSLMTETSGSGDESKSTTSDFGHQKSGSGGKNRASRFMRRMSSSLSSNRKTNTPTISPTVTEEEEVYNTIQHSLDSSALQPSVVSYIGDVNVQFPDNLLWKRRTMCLDSQGFLILSTGNTTTAATMSHSDRPAGTVKRYHLSDFRLPYIPEMEVQELPNSVCLDFVDGSGLQVACEDRAGQLNVLQILQEAHQNHISFGQ